LSAGKVYAIGEVEAAYTAGAAESLSSEYFNRMISLQGKLFHYLLVTQGNPLMDPWNIEDA
jgi:hypothetical protein